MAENMLTFLDLYKYLDGLMCGLEDKGGYPCDSTLRFTEQFCNENGVDFKRLKRVLEGIACCDCEVLMNATDEIMPGVPLPCL